MIRRPASEAGFSLLEMLVGLTLLALISVAVTQSVRSGLRLWQAAPANDPEAEWQQTEWLVERWLSRAVTSLDRLVRAGFRNSCAGWWYRAGGRRRRSRRR